MDTKRCSSCLEYKSVLDFHKDKQGKFGRRSDCKSCRNSEKQKEKRRKWYHENKDSRKESMRLYALSYKERRKELHRERQISDINYRLKRSLRSRLYNAIKNNYKHTSAVKDLGCSIDFLKSHIEKMFSKDMSWDNYGEWHIDHIVPISKFDLSKRSEQLKACHYTNLQPLWAEDNIKKSDSI